VIILFDHRLYGFAARRGPAAEDDLDLFVADQALRLGGISGPIGTAIRDHRLYLPPQNPAPGVDFPIASSSASIIDFSLIAIAPVRECRIPTLIGRAERPARIAKTAAAQASISSRSPPAAFDSSRQEYHRARTIQDYWSRNSYWEKGVRTGACHMPQRLGIEESESGMDKGFEVGGAGRDRTDE